LGKHDRKHAVFSAAPSRGLSEICICAASAIIAASIADLGQTVLSPEKVIPLAAQLVPEARFVSADLLDCQHLSQVALAAKILVPI
jgi:hypothetical protein